jgi:hypothetical protein
VGEDVTCVGECEGSKVGPFDGTAEGWSVGESLGEKVEGADVRRVGSLVGLLLRFEGELVKLEGEELGSNVSYSLGSNVGLSVVGRRVGIFEGIAVGKLLGLLVRLVGEKVVTVGEVLGSSVGRSDGSDVTGSLVGLFDRLAGESVSVLGGQVGGGASSGQSSTPVPFNAHIVSV